MVILRRGTIMSDVPLNDDSGQTRRLLDSDDLLASSTLVRRNATGMPPAIAT